MALHDDLLDQAQHLATRERKRPKQASLRRAVSASYYALFHLLAAEGARRLAPGNPAALRGHIGRAYDHGSMRQVCEQFGRRQPKGPIASLLADAIEAELEDIAKAFIALQQARHEADYDLTRTFDRKDALQKVQQARTAFTNWRIIRSSANATVFLAALLFYRHWR